MEGNLVRNGKKNVSAGADTFLALFVVRVISGGHLRFDSSSVHESVSGAPNRDVTRDSGVTYNRFHNRREHMPMSETMSEQGGCWPCPGIQ